MKTCLTCADDSCADRGTSQLACDDWTSMNEEGKPAPVDDVLAGLQVKVDALAHQFETFQRAVSDFVRALQEG